MTLEIKWTVSRGRGTYGYTICTAYVDGRKVARCNGGGYDMVGTVIGDWLARAYADRLVALTPEQMPERSHYDHETQRQVSDGRGFYGLSYHDPTYDPGTATIGTDCSNRTLGADDGTMVAEAEQAGKSFGLERYQAFYGASSKIPTERHTVPLIDGACGMSAVQAIATAIGIGLEPVPLRSKHVTLYQVIDQRKGAASGMA